MDAPELGEHMACLFVALIYSEGSGRARPLLGIWNNPLDLSILGFGVRQTWARIQALPLSSERL